jgi:hypothetical protein
MLTTTAKTSPQGVSIEYINLPSMVAATEKELAQYRLELKLDCERRNARIPANKVALSGFGSSARSNR